MKNKPRQLTPEEQEIFIQYYTEYYSSILRTALRRVKDGSLAEVAAQETFITAWIRFDVFQASPNPVGWLFITLGHKCNQVNRERAQYANHVVLYGDVSEVNKGKSYDQYFSTLSDCEEVRLLSKFYFEGYSLKEMAQIYDCSVAAMKMRLKRTREKLAEKLK